MNHGRRFSLVFILSLSVVCLYAITSFGAPSILNYQGTLTDDQGSPVTGSVPMIFRIYATIDAGTAQALWNSGTVNVAVVNGAFSIELGDTSTTPPQPALTTSIFSDDTRYLGITVNGQELVPRKRLASVPYALNASAGIPQGAIIMWSGSAASIPQGWALCDGSNGTPNLSGRFVLGAVAPAYPQGQSGGAATINLQHSHTTNDHTHTYSGTTGDYTLYGSHPPRSVQDVNETSYAHSHTYSGTTSGSSNRGTDSQLSASQSILPPYYALCFIMKL